LPAELIFSYDKGPVGNGSETITWRHSPPEVFSTKLIALILSRKEGGDYHSLTVKGRIKIDHQGHPALHFLAPKVKPHKIESLKIATVHANIKGKL
jgi:hypothetical protein